ncbi:DUF992 domain-containing protein [Kaistia algarum]|uniref:DUF992 domain-containing protein n=1 Tax=Kaistia algarum TaxID=2083279 RepID=UPI000CE82E95|nr:DUF992 domain-containing protein [Kaistia algarum]MCX5514436.1 DUF992 domain-containing protein [Kaistia algarum]PPE79172.1 DUF992 domain-containing protein [Kaistia algarum]
MKILGYGLFALAMALPLASPAFAEKAAVGKLECDVSSGIGLFVVEKQTMKCKFTPVNSNAVDYYTGKINEYGVALGEIQKGVLLWGVVSATDTVPGPGSLAGDYAGAGADVAFVGGLGANVLVGGSSKSIALQPLSVEGEAGFNVAAGVTTVTLVAAPAP